MDANVPQQPWYQQPIQSVVDTSQATQDLLRQREQQQRAYDAMFADNAARLYGTSQPK